ncbi:Cytochrome P450 [Mycena indigotica]|uniref:Cytochrome P450 n=1 Tax=Mycena indigotica TaxID=2126181 RepID=A0A8H6SCE1_9AGAR|nr:Cytochrome P450 [Mycena indigotica]KAF7296839.1 Cytochrome P450 [Mycena indigotica]
MASPPELPSNFMLVAVLCCVITVIIYGSRKGRMPLPPGPPAKPLLGHLHLMPSSNASAVFHNWARIYGDVMHLHIPGKSIIILSSHRAAMDLLQAKGSIYSARPSFLLYELAGWTNVLTFLTNDDRFNRHRQALHGYLSAANCVAFQPFQLKAARKLAQAMLNTHVGEFDQHINRETGTRRMSAGTPLDFFPFLQYLPTWFPGAYYAGLAQKMRPIFRKIYDIPIKLVYQQQKEGIAPPSFLLHHLQLMSVNKGILSIEELKGAGATIFAAGKATTASTLMVFLLAMVLNPKVQRKAQEELNRVVGHNRLPTFADSASLPYIEAVVQETYRWNTVTPMGVPHVSSAEDTYQGWKIPSGSLVLVNVRAISRDVDVYQDPDQFNPDRFLPKPEGLNEPRFSDAFGYGRRICVGQHLAHSSVWIVIATILATCTITNATDESGNIIVPVPEMSDGLDSHPHAFQFVVNPRQDTEEVPMLLATEIDEL